MKKQKAEKAYRLDKVDSVVSIIFTALTYLSIIAVTYIMLNTVVNVISRAFFSKSINGSVQTSQIVLSLVAMCALPVVTMFNGHIKVDLVYVKMPKRIQFFMNCLNFALCGVMMFITGHYTFLKAAKVRTQGITMDVPKFPHWPIYDLIAIMMIVSGICAIYNLLHYIITGTVIHPTFFAEVKARLKAKKNGQIEEGTES